MNYTQSLHYLDQFLNLEKITFSPDNRLWNLERMEFLLDSFGHPEKNFLPVIIAGTKGKGSTGFFLESMLKSADIVTGYYHSPHLEEPLERIRLNGASISREDWAWAAQQVRQGLGSQKKFPIQGDFTYFEILTLMAVLCFQKKKVRIGIFEVGMGGRLDATNALKAPVVILTPISFDHESVLGTSLKAIASEKAAVIHQGAHVIYSVQKPEALRVIQKRMKNFQAFSWRAPVLKDEKLGLEGAYQGINGGLALKAAEVLKQYYQIPLSLKAMKAGLQNSSWPGRLEKILQSPHTILDAAHNPASAQALTAYLKKKYPSRNGILIFGVSRDKKSERMLKIFSDYFDTLILTTVPNTRTKDIGSLCFEAKPFFKRVLVASEPVRAFQLAKMMSDAKSLVVITGSFYIAGALRRYLKGNSTYA